MFRSAVVTLSFLASVPTSAASFSCLPTSSRDAGLALTVSPASSGYWSARLFEESSERSFGDFQVRRLSNTEKLTVFANGDFALSMYEARDHGHRSSFLQIRSLRMESDDWVCKRIDISAEGRLEEALSYDALKSRFAEGALPIGALLDPGWYTGRCFTDYAPTVEKAGVIALIDAGAGAVKTVIPALVIREEDPARWDVLDPETLEMLKELLFAEENLAAVPEGKSLTSTLVYQGSVIGKLHTRAWKNELIVKMTELQYEDEGSAKTNFYCRFFRKVHGPDFERGPR